MKKFSDYMQEVTLLANPVDPRARLVAVYNMLLNMKDHPEDVADCKDLLLKIQDGLEDLMAGM